MKIIIFYSILLLICQAAYSQPYIYYKALSSESTPDNPYYELRKIDLKDNSDSASYSANGEDMSFYQDQTQSFMFLSTGRDNNIGFDNINPENAGKLLDVADGINISTDIGKVLYSKRKNYLYFFSNIETGHRMYESLCTYDPVHESTIATTLLPTNSNINAEAFFSSDENTIYFEMEDTTFLPRKDNKSSICSYSTLTNQIISKWETSQLGYPAANVYGLCCGRNGVGVIESFFRNSQKDNYFRVYNFEKGTGSGFIKIQGYYDPYMILDGRYLILEESIKFGEEWKNSGKTLIYDVSSMQLIKTLNLPPKGEIYVFDNYPDMFYYFLPDERTVSSYNINELVSTIQKFNLNVSISGHGSVTKTPDQTTYDSVSIVKLKAIADSGYKFTGWSGDITGTSDTITVIMNGNKNVTATFVQSLPGLNIKLIDSKGDKLVNGNLQYYEGIWKDAVNNGDGTFRVNTNSKTISLRMNYEYSSQTKTNVAVGQDTVIFQTLNTQVKLQDSQGNPLDQGTVQYYAGAWRDFGIATNGIIVKELLPGSYSFRMNYAYSSKDMLQKTDSSNVVIFKTVNTRVQLQNSQGNPIDQGTVQYYAGAWRDFGVTTNGTVQKELLPNSYSFRMIYAYASIDKQQNTTDNPIVIFRTVKASVQLKNSLGSLIDGGSVQYYAGNVWRTFGTTLGGIAEKELLPNNYSFRMSHEFVSMDKQQDISSNNIVSFSTLLTTIRVKDAQNQPVSGAVTSYYSGAWRQIGQTQNGEVMKELLPSNLSFRAQQGSRSVDKTQNTAANNIIEIIL